MKKRFALQWQNVEFRVWLLLLPPIGVISTLILLFADYEYRYLISVLLLAAWFVYYSWRYLYRRNLKKKCS